ncbi:hypothetical protein HaLaN_11519 [Haematococcus lacustris]|uniref:Uncharacterized protein n=1 Tax=Haematococcus lacustris TaxID=44745 RepID=A0A699Z1C9_HAELA|nr:hypothetical protein HaLaN_11519 [Haematococcus lacustris]
MTSKRLWDNPAALPSCIVSSRWQLELASALGHILLQQLQPRSCTWRYRGHRGGYTMLGKE